MSSLLLFKPMTILNKKKNIAKLDKHSATRKAISIILTHLTHNLLKSLGNVLCGSYIIKKSNFPSVTQVYLCCVIFALQAARKGSVGITADALLNFHR